MEAPLEVQAVVVEGRLAKQQQDPASLAAQLEEAKAAAQAAADRMQSLLQQMAIMEAQAAERRLAELNLQAQIASASAAASAASPADVGHNASPVLPPPVLPPPVLPPPVLPASAPSAAPNASADEPLIDGPSKTERHITMTDVFGGGEDEPARVNNDLRWVRDTSKRPTTNPTRESKTDSEEEGDGKLGTVMGVFVPCLQNILGTIYFLRLSWIVALQGISNSLLLVGIACATTFTTSLSLSAIATNGAIKSGGPYYLISRALGPEFGGSVGLCFYLGTTVAGAMYMLGTSEPLLQSFPQLEICGLDSGEGLPTTNIIIYGFIILALCALLIFAGVKYVSRTSPFFLVAVLISIFLIWVGLLAGDRDVTATVMSSPCKVDGVAPNASEVALLELAGANATVKNGAIVIDRIQGPGLTHIQSNYWPPNPLIEDQECKDAGYECDFTFGLALFFPSVTGIMAGSNRSGDLKDAQRSIPLGTLCATLATSLLYLLSTFVFGAVTDRDILNSKNNILFTAVVSWPSEYVVRIGIILSAFGAGLQSLTGAPRLLQAIANDNLIPILRPFQGTGEPRRPLALTVFICAACVASGNVNAVAPIITMFFLLCYSFVNFACLLQDILNEPNWRPRFRFYHPLTSFTGLVLCLFIMFFTRWYFALVSILVVIALYGYIQMRKVQAQWGDGLKGLRYSQARKALEELEKLDGQTHIKNWRPQILLLVKPGTQNQAVTRPKMLSLLKQLKGARGLSILGMIIPGRLASDARLQSMMERALRRMRDENKVAGFSQVIMCPDITHGLTALIQTAGLGGLYPNTVMVGWSEHWRKCPERAMQMCRLLLTAAAYNNALIVVKGIDHIPDSGGRMTRPMDIWWMVHDGGLQLLLVTILRKGRVWASCPLRVFCVLQFGEDPGELQKKVESFIYQMRIEAQVKCVVLSEGAALVDRSKDRGGRKPWQISRAIVSAPIGGMLNPVGVWDEDDFSLGPGGHSSNSSSPGGSNEGSPRLKPTPMPGMLKRANSSGAMSPMSAARAARSKKRNSFSEDQMRGAAAAATKAIDEATEEAPVVPVDTLATSAGYNGDSELPSRTAAKAAAPSTSGAGRGSLGRASTGLARTASRSSCQFSPAPATEMSLLETEATADEAATLLATRIFNRLIHKYSNNSALVMTNLPMPGETQSPAHYMHQVDTLVEGLPLCMLVMGQKNADVVTLFS